MLCKSVGTRSVAEAVGGNNSLCARGLHSRFIIEVNFWNLTTSILWRFEMKAPLFKIKFLTRLTNSKSSRGVSFFTLTYQLKQYDHAWYLSHTCGPGDLVLQQKLSKTHTIYISMIIFARVKDQRQSKPLLKQSKQDFFYDTVKTWCLLWYSRKMIFWW